MYPESQSIAIMMTLRTIMFGCLISCLLFLSLDTAHAQEISPRSYLFVEVKDAEGHAVAEATVQVSNADGKQVLKVETNKF